jgi:hypothetical protein
VCNGLSNIFWLGQAMPARSRCTGNISISTCLKHLVRQDDWDLGALREKEDGFTADVRHNSNAGGIKREDLPIGAGKKEKHTMVDKVVNTISPSSCSLKPAASSTLMRPVGSAASQSRCIVADLWKLGQFRSRRTVLPCWSMVVPVAVTCQHYTTDGFIRQLTDGLRPSAGVRAKLGSANSQ